MTSDAIEGQAGKWRIEWRGSVPSTMEWARQEARKGAPGYSVFAAREQVAGRGRSGRVWSSPRGGLYASLLLREPSSQWAPFFPLAGALAVRNALTSWGPDCRILVKWPNDVMAGPVSEEGGLGKVAGVLTEATAVGQKVAWVIVGLGVNLDVPQGELPRDVDPPAVSFAAIGGRAPALEEAVTGLLDEFGGLLRKYAKEPGRLVAEVEPVLAMRGQEVRVERRGGERDLVGVLEGLDDAGAAVIQGPEGPVVVPAWDLERLRAL